MWFSKLPKNQPFHLLSCQVVTALISRIRPGNGNKCTVLLVWTSRCLLVTLKLTWAVQCRQNLFVKCWNRAEYLVFCCLIFRTDHLPLAASCETSMSWNFRLSTVYAAAKVVKLRVILLGLLQLCLILLPILIRLISTLLFLLLLIFYRQDKLYKLRNRNSGPYRLQVGLPNFFAPSLDGPDHSPTEENASPPRRDRKTQISCYWN